MQEYITPEHYEIAAKNGICERLVYQRVNDSGWSIRRAITTPRREKRQGLWTQWGEIATANGICRGTFMNRVSKRKGNMTPEEAATKPTMSSTEKAKHARSVQVKKQEEKIEFYDYLNQIENNNK